jgi:hypothetical protein
MTLQVRLESLPEYGQFIPDLYHIHQLPWQPALSVGHWQCVNALNRMQRYGEMETYVTLAEWSSQCK